MHSNSDLDFAVEGAFIDPDLDLVTFEEGQSAYKPGHDIFVVYQLGSQYRPSSRDWIGLYRVGWADAQDYITFEWAPKVSRNDSFPLLRSVLFQAKNIGVEGSQVDKYQLLYISRAGQVTGVSKTFYIAHTSDNNGAFICGEQSLEDIGSITLIENSSSPKPESLDSFEIIQSSTALLNAWCEQASNTPVPPEGAVVKLEDHTSLTNSFPSLQESMLQVIPPKAKDAEADKGAQIEETVPPKQIVPLYSTKLKVGLVTSIEDDLPVFGPEVKPTSATNLVDDSCPEDSPSACSDLALLALPDSCMSPLNMMLIPKPESALVPVRSQDFGYKTSAGQCHVCRHRSLRMRSLRRKCVSLEAEVDALTRDLKITEEVNDLKSVMLEELSNELCTVSTDKHNLLACNEAIYKDKLKLMACVDEKQELLVQKDSILYRLERDNMHLREDASWKQELLENLEIYQTRLAEEKATLEERLEKLKLTEKEKEKVEEDLAKQKEQTDDLQNSLNQACQEKVCLCAEVLSLEHQRGEVQSQMDNILHTLAIKGVSKITDANGNELALDASGPGQEVELHGWTPGKRRGRAERHLQAIARDNAVANLTLDLQQSKDKLRQLEQVNTDLQARLQEESSLAVSLRAELVGVRADLQEEQDKEASLSRLLISARREGAELRRQLGVAREEARGRVQSLQDGLEAAKLVQAMRSSRTREQCLQMQPEVATCASQCVQMTPEVTTCGTQVNIEHEVPKRARLVPKKRSAREMEGGSALCDGQQQVCNGSETRLTPRSPYFSPVPVVERQPQPQVSAWHPPMKLTARVMAQEKTKAATPTTGLTQDMDDIATALQSLFPEAEPLKQSSIGVKKAKRSPRKFYIQVRQSRKRCVPGKPVPCTAKGNTRAHGN